MPLGHAKELAGPTIRQSDSKVAVLNTSSLALRVGDAFAEQTR
jgi:hypothetical protein